MCMKKFPVIIYTADQGHAQGWGGGAGAVAILTISAIFSRLLQSYISILENGDEYLPLWISVHATLVDSNICKTLKVAEYRQALLSS